MDEETNREIEELKTKIQVLQDKISSIETRSTSLGRYLDTGSKDIIREVARDDFFDFYWNSVFLYTTNFESLDGFTASSGVGLLGGAANLVTDGTGSEFESIQRTFQPSGTFDFTKESQFRVVIAADQITNQNIQLIVGSNGNGHFYGFDIEDAVIRGVTKDGTTQKTVTLNKSIDDSNLFLLEAKFFPGNRVDFYVNKVLYGSSTSNLPTTPTTILWIVTITEQEASAKTMWLYSVEYLQRRQ